MVILGIETSCDETGAVVLKQDKQSLPFAKAKRKNGIQILSNQVKLSFKNCAD